MSLQFTGAPSAAPPSRRRSTLLAPGVWLFRRCRFGAKALVISAAFAVPVMVLGTSYLMTQADRHADIVLERAGLDLAREVSQVMVAAGVRRQQLLMHSAGAAANAPDQVLAGALQRLQQAPQRHARVPGTAEALKPLAAAQQALAPAQDGLVKVFASQARFSQALLKLLEHTTDASGLSLDPGADTFFAMDAALVALPQLSDQAGRLGGLSAAASQADKGGPIVEQEMARQDALLDLFADKLKSDLEKVAAQRPELAKTLDAAPLLKQLAALRDVATDSPGGGGAAQAAKVGAATAQTVQALWQLQHRTLQALDEMLAQRQQALQHSVAAVLVLVVLCIGAAAYLFFAFYLVMRGGLRRVSGALQRIGQGDLRQPVQANGTDEVAELLGDLDAMRLRLAGTLRAVRTAADQVSVSSQQLSSGTGDLARRTEQAASQLEESASAMEQMRATVCNTSASSHEASALAAGNAEVATRGGAVISEVLSTMQRIQDSSARIAEITGTIDGIAFQTNILALNAAVEAARAGESGRGFAVVAAEVRQLAQRSASAAREIKGLIVASVEHAQQGALVAKQAGDTIHQMVGNAARMHESLGAINTAAQEQASGIAQVHESVGELDRMTQQNASLVEETSSAATAMLQQARVLADEAARFELPAY